MPNQHLILLNFPKNIYFKINKSNMKKGKLKTEINIK